MEDNVVEGDDVEGEACEEEEEEDEDEEEEEEEDDDNDNDVGIDEPCPFLI